MSETTNIEPETTEVTEQNEEVSAEAVEPEAANEVEAATNDAGPGRDYDELDEDDIPVEPTTYKVGNRVDEKVIDGRLEAVAAAKEWSVESGQSIVVERTDGRVQMSFRDGALVDYVLETRKGRRG
ncbi:MAG: hypothetical protein CMH52_06075 [Myxococcales bacterium]|nr:hypothetical protein [Myxococcales bacterium]|tara:strand:- start:1805 stop:2182 length:378 start_codon:yes stop_codon:yes gene_type:complete